MKGVVLGICPDATLVDICHDVPHFSIYAGAYTIDQGARYFPAGAIHVVVVDPGVGGARRAIVMKACNQLFVAPDNGLLTMVADRDHRAEAREITNRTLFREPVSDTFHGRDIFSPTAAMLGNEAVPLEAIGPRLPSVERLSGLEPLESEPGRWTGRVLSVDHFGNVITNFPFSAFNEVQSQSFTTRAGELAISQFCRTFSEAAAGQPFLYAGSSGFLEIGINQSSAAAISGLQPGSPIYLHMHSARI